MKTETQEITHSSPRVIRIISQVLSYIFHPIFIPVYVIAFISYVHPTMLAGFDDGQRRYLMLIIILNLVFYPLLSTILLKAVGFIDSIFLHTKKDRIIPLIACGIFYFWCYTVFKEQNQYPKEISVFVLGIFLASSAALMANIYFKISLHAIGVGGLVGFFALLQFKTGMTMHWPLALTVVIAGAVCSARLFLGAHKSKDVYLGLLVGIASQFAAYYVVV